MTTEAGRRLAERLEDLTDGMFPYSKEIHTIEAEARAALLDPDRLARVIQRAFYIGWCAMSWHDVDEWKRDLDEPFEWYASANDMAAAIVKAYEEEDEKIAAGDGGWSESFTAKLGLDKADEP